MTEKVTVCGDDDNNVITVSEKNPEFGWIFVEQLALIFQNDWVRTTKRKARIMGSVETLNKIGYTKGQVLPGKIVVKESFQPFDHTNPDRHLKIAGDCGIICRVDDQPIYRKSFYTLNENEQDELIMHNNTEEIREVMTATKLLNSLSTNHLSLNEHAAL
jgi:hypothetical protein